MVAERSALRPFCFPRTPGRRAVMASPRDRRSLRRQLAEDDDALEVENAEYEDNGGGVTTFLDNETPGPGFSRKRIPADQPQVEEKNPRKKPVAFEDVSDPSDSESNTGTRARMVAVGDSGDELFATARARMDVAEVVLTTPTRAVPDGPSVGTTPAAVPDSLAVGVTPSTPEEERQLDDDNCPATRAEFRK